MSYQFPNTFLFGKEYAKAHKTRLKFIEEFEMLIAEMQEHWDPHLKIEYSKMCIRTVAEKIQADRKRKDREEEEEYAKCRMLLKN